MFKFDGQLNLFTDKSVFALLPDFVGDFGVHSFVKFGNESVFVGNVFRKISLENRKSEIIFGIKMKLAGNAPHVDINKF